jgi:ribonuclease-3
MKSRELTPLEHALGHKFRRMALLEQALTHSSRARELESQGAAQGAAGKAADNEQLEFLGDAVLGFVTSQELFQRFPDYQEGQLSKARAYLVSGKHLIRAAKKLKLGQFLRLGHGEEKSGGRSKAALQVNALEAVLAAMYLDAGLEKARQFILKRILEPELKKLARHGGDGVPITDYKSALQEAAHTMGRGQPSYVVVKEEGPEHKKTFTVEARLNDNGSRPEYAGRAKGSTKKKAEQDAAKKALEYLRAVQHGATGSRGRALHPVKRKSGAGRGPQAG